jgi:hypothetical protein
VPATRAASDGVLEQLRREWLIGYGSANTRTAYDRDLTNWLTFLERSGIDPTNLSPFCRGKKVNRSPTLQNLRLLTVASLNP